MRVGLTYDLRDDYRAQGYSEEVTAEFDSIVTIDALDAALTTRGLETDRIGQIRQLTQRLAAGDRWDFVFNICEGLAGFGREAQVPALLDAWDIGYTFSDPLTMALTLDKATTKRVVRDHGIATAAFALVGREAEARALVGLLPAFVKPLAEGTGKGISAASLVATVDEAVAACADLLRRFDQAVLVERYLPGREFTVGILGTGTEARAIGVMEIELSGAAEAGGYSYENKEHYEDRVRYRLVDDEEARAAADTALAAWRALRCRDGGRVDLRSDAGGVPNFLEVNPLAGLHPVRSDLVILAGLAGMSYQSLIDGIVESCLERVPEARPLRRRAVAG